MSELRPIPSRGLIPARDLDKNPILETHHLGIDFGGLTAVNEFELTVGRTEIAGLIGPNGAGKTTVFNLLTNVYKPTRGTILLDGVSTAGKNTAQLNRMGIGRTFQNIRLFKDMSVMDNILVGLHNEMKYTLPEALREFSDYRMLVYAIVLILVMLVSHNPMMKNLASRIFLREVEDKKAKKGGDL